MQHQPPLQRLFIRQALLPDAPLAVRAAPPVEFDGLVAADVDIGPWEELCHLIQNVLQKPEGFLLAGADQVGENAGNGYNFIGIGHVDLPEHSLLEHLPAAAELGIGGQHGAGMAGDFDFRHNVNAPLPGIGYHLAGLLLGVEAAVVLRFRHIAEKGIAPARADFRQGGIFLDFNPPALVVGEVPVHRVQAADRSGINELENVLNGHIVPAHIQHKAQIRTRGFCHFLFHPFRKNQAVKSISIIHGRPGPGKGKARKNRKILIFTI